MQQQATCRRIIFALFFTMLILSSPARSRHLPCSPSPSPADEMPTADVPKPSKAMAQRVMRGSFPATCDSKCNRCEPCMPVEVSVRTTDLEEENEYYPQVWKCMCGHSIFSP